MHKSTFFMLAMLTIAAGCSSEQDSSTHDSTIVSTPAVNEVPDEDLLIIPGVSAGKIKIDENAAPLYELFGKPDAGDAAMQKAVAIWYDDHDPAAYAKSIYSVRDTGDNPIARVRQIRVTSPEYKTKTGIGVNSSLTEIQGEFTVKKVPDYPASAAKEALFYSSSGIAFEIDTNMRCRAVLIHPAGEELKTTSLPLREN